jgi:hypothetical protein
MHPLLLAGTSLLFVTCIWAFVLGMSQRKQGMKLASEFTFYIGALALLQVAGQAVTWGGSVAAGTIIILLGAGFAVVGGAHLLVSYRRRGGGGAD